MAGGAPTDRAPARDVRGAAAIDDAITAMGGAPLRPMRRLRRETRPHRRRRWWGVVLGLAAIAIAAAVLFDRATRITPPALSPPAPEPLRFDHGTTSIGASSLARRGALWVMRVAGDPVHLGYEHARLTAPMMVTGEAHMLDLFSRFVPSAPLRMLLTAFVRARYRGVDRTFSPERRAEIYGESVGYGDRGPAFLTPYHRFVYLHALYDIALALERSPLLGCTAFAAGGGATGGTTPGHTIVGRNFDLDVDAWFDVDKVVQIYAPQGKLPFASVAWPGMTGVVTGMNAAGIWVSVNGARAGTPDADGVPVVFTTRTILEEAHTLDEAIAIAERDPPMASHMLLLAEGVSGESAVVERAPGRPAGVRRGLVTVVANHYRTPAFAADPKDADVRDHTSTVAREARMRELVTRFNGRIDPLAAIAILRDRAGVGDRPLPLGNRNALDALIATHSVVADLTEGVLWVSEGPHTLGAYRRIDLRARRDGGVSPDEARGDLAADAFLGSEALQRQALGARLRAVAARERRRGDDAAAAEEYSRAVALRDDDHAAWRGLADTRAALGDADGAHAAWARVVALAPESPALETEARRNAGEP